MNEHDVVILDRIFGLLKPHIKSLNLSGFSGVKIVDDDANIQMSAGIANGVLKIQRGYLEGILTKIRQGDSIAFFDLLNTFHHELCHIDVNNKMPFLSEPLSNEQVWPNALIIRFVREYFACSGSATTMNLGYLENRIVGGVQEINSLCQQKTRKNFCKIICNLAYLLGDCVFQPCGYFHKVHTSIKNDVIVTMTKQLFSAITEIGKEYPLNSFDNFAPLGCIIQSNWEKFSGF